MYVYKRAFVLVDGYLPTRLLQLAHSCIVLCVFTGPHPFPYKERKGTYCRGRLAGAREGVYYRMKRFNYHVMCICVCKYVIHCIYVNIVCTLYMYVTWVIPKK